MSKGLTPAPWAVHTLCSVGGRTVTALQNQGPDDLWPTARWGPRA